MRIIKRLAASLPIIFLAGFAQAQDAGSMLNTIYIGGGTSNDTDSFANQDTPFAIGFMHQAAAGKAVYGIDFAGEGTALDSTWGQTKQPVQALSFNFLYGTNVADNGHVKADVALLLGLREATAACPKSYLGYRCYADTDPDMEYKANFGAVMNLSFNKLSVGLRATGESTQVLLGMRF